MNTLATQVQRLAFQVEVLADLVRVSPEEKAVSADKDARDFRIAKYNLLLGICTSILTLLSLGALGTQAYFAQRTLDETESEQRAWVRVSLQPNDLTWLKTKDRNSSSVSMGVKFSVSNSGHLPAFNVRSIIYGYLKPIPYKDSINIDTNLICKTLEKDNHAVESTIFPGENAFRGPVDIPNQTQFSASLDLLHNEDAALVPNGSPVILALYGCVLYKTSFNGPFHKTAFADIVFHGLPGSREILGFFPTVVPSLNEIKLLNLQSPLDIN